MQVRDFEFHLPTDLIASEPPANRTDSRLLVLSRPSGAVADRQFGDILEYLKPHDLLVLNDTRVIPARLLGRKETGGAVEILLERLLGPHQALAQIRASKPPKPGSRLLLEPRFLIEVLAREGAFFKLAFPADQPLTELLDAVGHVPLPPYINRADTPADRDRYQTVYARHPGAVAAPTAGLHFDDALLAAVREHGANTATVTLHVGAGTFQPVRSETVEGHEMHSEWLSVPEATVAAVAACKARGGRVIAVGTTVVRSLETAAAGGQLAPYSGETDIFIYPGFEFRVTEGLITNFHLSGSTLMMLVSALAGREQILSAYAHAVKAQYRFFSYGDAMFILPNGEPADGT